MNEKRIGKKSGILISIYLLLCTCIFVNVTNIQAQPEKLGNIEFDINVVHTNDIHGRVKEDTWNQVIGLPKVKTYIDQVSKGKDLSLALDGGDTFHGQSIATLVKGESVAKLLGNCGYDAVGVGNHDWNYGKERLKELESIVRANGSQDFSLLAGNVVDEKGNKFFDQNYLIKQVEKDGKVLKVGVFGVIDPLIYNATSPNNVQGLAFTDMQEYSLKATAKLKEQGCQIIIGMAHCIDPKSLASSVDGVNLWIAGHEHTTLNEVVTTPNGNSALVVETGYNLWNFGNVEISCTLDADANVKKLTMKENLVDYQTGLALSPDVNVQNHLNSIEASQQEILLQLVGSTPIELDGVWEHTRINETTMGRAVSEAYLLATNADIAFENAGGIRSSIKKGQVTYQDVLDVSPYGNYIVTKELTGKEILEMLETSLEIMKANIAANESGDYDGWPGNSGNMLQVGGIDVEYNLSLPTGKRIIKAFVQGKTIESDQTYIVAMNNYLPNDVIDYPQLEGKANIHEYQSCEDALAAFLNQSENIIMEKLEHKCMIETNAKHQQAPLEIMGNKEIFNYGETGQSLHINGGSTQGTITYVSSNEDIVTIDHKGKLTINGVGNAVVTAIMSGDELYEDVTAQIMIQVEKAVANLELTYSKDTIIAAVEKVDSGVYASGTVLFIIDNSIEIKVELDDNGQAMIKLPQLSSNKHTIKAIYQGDKNYQSVKKEIEIENVNLSVNTSDKSNYEKYLYLSLVTIANLLMILKKRERIN